MALLLALFLFAGTRVLWLVVASSTATLVNRATLVLWTRRLLPAARFEPATVSRATTARVLAFGVWTSVHGLGQLITWTVPILLLNRFASALDVATFHAGRLADVQIRSLLQAVEGPAQPALVGLYAREGRDAVNQLYYRGGRYSLWLVLLPVAPLLVFATPLYRLYAGEEYARAGWVMFALLASYPFQYASSMYYRVAHAIGKVGRFHSSFLVLQLVAVSAVGYAVIVRGEGALGAAVAIGLAFTLLHVVWIWPLGLVLVRGRWRAFARDTLVRGLAPFAASLATSLLLSCWLAGDSWLALGLAAGCALAVYALTLRLWCLDPFDLELLERLRARLGLHGARGAAR
jgi:O-antigen/teichoic acid export membrane protein